MKQAFTFIAVALLTILTSCENNKKQCYQFTTKMAGQTVITYENCTKAVAEETVKQLKAKGASSASYKVVDSSKCNGNSSSTTKQKCWYVGYTYKGDTQIRSFATEWDANNYYNSIKGKSGYKYPSVYQANCQ